MRILLISDIHANIEALTALDENFDALLCMGDLVDYGPSPKECIAELRTKATTIVRGNHDNAVAFRQDCGCHPDYKALSVATRQLMWDLLNPEEIEFLRHLPLTTTISLGGARFFLCHAAPSGPLFKYMPASTSEDLWEKELDGIEADFVLLGHTHEPFKRKIGDKWVINPGSLGQPKGNGPLASYAVWENGGVSHIAIPYDYRRTMRKLDQTPLDLQIRQKLRHVLAFGTLP